MMKNWWIFAIIAAVTIVIGTLVFLGVHTTSYEGYINGKTWCLEQDIQKFDWVRHEDYNKVNGRHDMVTSLIFDNYPSVPSGARNVSRHYREDYTYVEDSNGNDVKSWYTKYYINYEVQEWCFSRTAKSTGDMKIKPTWPEPNLGINPQERLGQRKETYNFTFIIPIKGKEVTKIYTTHDGLSYENLKIDKKYSCEVNGFGCILKINNFDLNDWNY